MISQVFIISSSKAINLIEDKRISVRNSVMDTYRIILLFYCRHNEEVSVSSQSFNLSTIVRRTAHPCGTNGSQGWNGRPTIVERLNGGNENMKYL
ncbi:MAG: hypothetical protein LBF62_11120 [Tannerellaceae bacterium]|nr:hypothetical protein [Tannerellaceae bacterium]